MSELDTTRLNFWSNAFMEHRERLMNLAKRNLNPVLSRRFTPEDVVQDTLADACGKIDFFENEPEIPTYFKLRTLLFQTISALERKHLQSRKRDAYKEVEVLDDNETAVGGLNWNSFADSVTGPLTKIFRQDRYELLQNALMSMSENDRQILELRHFDGLSNTDCAEILHIEHKAASIRYVRALQRLHQKLIQLTEFRR